MKKNPTATIAALALASLGDATQIKTILFLLHFIWSKGSHKKLLKLN
jgi:hypothetical protein